LPILISTRALRAVLLFLALVTLLTPVSVRAADSGKTLQVVLQIAETSFDPAFASDAASDEIIASITEAMLDYDYLARPVKLVPRTLAAMPVVEEGGKTFTLKIKKGIFFTSDPAFKGKPRELIAADYQYALKRIIDPAVKSPWLWMLEGKIAGADEVRAKALATGKFDYDAPMAGLAVVDRYTLRIQLKSADLRFLYVLAVPNTAAMAREVVEAYGNDLGAHPVGTGPFMLGEYKRSSRIELVANPGYRGYTYEPSGPIPSTSQAVAVALKGKRLPLLSRIVINVMDEGQARWLAFLNREIDYLGLLPANLTDQALVQGKLKPDLAAKGILHQVLVRPNVAFTYFNMEDPVVGGYAPERIALRRAISMAYNNDEAIRVLYSGRALPASGPIPPDVAGYNPQLKTNAQVYDPAASRALLDKFGYKDRDGDGFREAPDGKPLVIERWSPPTSIARERDELWKKNLDAVGIRVAFKYDKLPELRKMARTGKIQMRDDGWNADYPDAENFMQLLYGANIGQVNYARFNLPEFNKLFEQAQSLPDSPERVRVFDRMTGIVIAYSPWRVRINDIEDTLAHRWVRNYVPHPMRQEGWEFIDIDEALRTRSR
jgi:ABC-type transport system substrate-binding protein